MDFPERYAVGNGKRDALRSAAGRRYKPRGTCVLVCVQSRRRHKQRVGQPRRGYPQRAYGQGEIVTRLPPKKRIAVMAKGLLKKRPRCGRMAVITHVGTVGRRGGAAFRCGWRESSAADMRHTDPAQQYVLSRKQHVAATSNMVRVRVRARAIFRPNNEVCRAIW